MHNGKILEKPRTADEVSLYSTAQNLLRSPDDVLSSERRCANSLDSLLHNESNQVPNVYCFLIVLYALGNLSVSNNAFCKFWAQSLC